MTPNRRVTWQATSDFIASTLVLGPLLRALLPGRLHQSPLLPHGGVSSALAIAIPASWLVLGPYVRHTRCEIRHLDGFHVSGLVSAIRIVSATTRDDVSRSNRTRCELRGSRLSGLHSIARTSAFRGPKIR